MTILLLDDHPLFRAGLRLLLGTLGQGQDILEASNIKDALELVAAHPEIQLCFLDLQLHDEDGLQIIENFKTVAPDVLVVIVSASEETSIMRACLDAGAMSYIPKSATPEVLAEALQYVLAGSIYLPSQLIFEHKPIPTAPLVLTPRHKDVLKGLCLGLPTKSIARNLSLSDHTVKEYISNLFRILNVRNRTEAVIKATQLKLL